ncbi:hypothetical protein, partial [Hymenobacter agri]
ACTQPELKFASTDIITEPSSLRPPPKILRLYFVYTAILKADNCYECAIVGAGLSYAAPLAAQRF